MSTTVKVAVWVSLEMNCLVAAMMLLLMGTVSSMDDAFADVGHIRGRDVSLPEVVDPA